MVREILPFVANWKEAIKPITVEEIKNPEFFDGLVEFRFDYVANRKEYNEPIAGLNKTRKVKSLKTYDKLPFKNGDRVLIENGIYAIESVEEMIDDKFKPIIARYPNAWKEYSHKIITLV